MNYSKFTIQYYRGFHEEQKLMFALPNPEKTGSGITFIVGENNTGKTTLIEALCLKDKQQIRSSEKIPQGSPQFRLYDGSGLLKLELKLLRDNSYTLNEHPKTNQSESFEIVPARRYWGSAAQGSNTIEAVINNTVQQNPRAQTSNTQVSLALKNIEEDPEKYAAFIKLVKRVIPEFSSFAIGNEDREFVEYATNNGVKHKSDFLGDGVISILRILSHLHTVSSRPLIIDEPELSLHPLAQKRLFGLIAEKSKNRQIIISTHSPYFVSWEYIKNGAVLNKVTKHEDKKSEIHQLQDYSFYEKLVEGANWQQPFLMDIVAKEIFFHDNFLFVEGQEDVGLLRQANDIDESINLFGYGVRGWSAFKFALQLAKDLGIQKAGVILDAGSKEEEIKSALVEDFPNYKIVQWHKEDIRDKEKYDTKKKNGYFDKHGKKKDSAELEDYHDKIDEINKYFGNNFSKKSQDELSTH